MPRRLQFLVGAAVVLASACLAAAIATASTTGAAPNPPAAVLCAGLLLASLRFHLQIRLGAQRLLLTWFEAAVMLTLAVIPPAWVVLLTPVAVSLGLAGRVAPIKLLYNVAVHTIAAAAAAGIAGAASGHHPLTPRGAAVLAAAGVVSGLITHVLVAAAIAAAEDTSVLASWRAGAGLQLLTAAGNVPAALLVLTLARQDLRLVAALPLVALCLHQGYVGRLRGYQERVAGQRQLKALAALGADLDQPAVVRRAAAEVGALVAADVVEIRLAATGSEPPVLFRHHRRGEPWTGPPQEAPPVPARRVAQLAIAGDTRSPAGELRIWIAGGHPDLRLSERDEVAVASLVAAIPAALANARAHAMQTYHATHDRITALPDRPRLLAHIDTELTPRPATASGPVALILIDLSGYREIVRTLGHDVAERLLAHAADHLRHATESGEYLAHVGADDFAVFVPDATDPAFVRRRAQQLLHAIAAPIRLDAGRVTLAAAAGIAYSPVPTSSGPELLRQAIVALDQARATSLPVEFYDPSVDVVGSPSALVLASELHTAVRPGHVGRPRPAHLRQPRRPLPARPGTAQPGRRSPARRRRQRRPAHARTHRDRRRRRPRRRGPRRAARARSPTRHRRLRHRPQLPDQTATGTRHRSQDRRRVRPRHARLRPSRRHLPARR